MQCQKHKFKLGKEKVYLNGAYMSPNLKSVHKAGLEGIDLKNTPYDITMEHFFNRVDNLRMTYATLIKVKNPKRIALSPSVSYAMSSFAKNIKLKKEEEIICLDEQFPSNYYCWQELAVKNSANLKSIKRPKKKNGIANAWNRDIIDAINPKTKVITMSHVHWADGTVFDLINISKKAQKNGALLLIDGTQSIGAYPFDQTKIKADGIANAAYKWLLGPYAFGLAYYGETFDGGVPLESSWINKVKSDDFANLVNYQDDYRPYARRYEVGEASNFIGVNMALASILQLHQWPAEEIQAYCHKITKSGIKRLRNAGYLIEDDSYRAKHLFGIRLPKKVKMEKIKKRLTKEKIVVSYRGDAIRVSPYLYNTKSDFDRFTDVLIKLT